MTLYKRFKIDQSANDQQLHLAKSLNSKSTTWVTDALMLNNINKLVVLTSGRELRFFSISNEHCIEELCLYGSLFCIYLFYKNNYYSSKGLKSVPTCIEYWFDEKV